VRESSNARTCIKLTTSGRGCLVVWLVLKPKQLLSDISLLIKVPFPTPDGPTMTRALGEEGVSTGIGTLLLTEVEDGIVLPVLDSTEAFEARV
jgi:hypothetical protein